MKKVFLILALAANIAACAQKIDAIINTREVERIERILASDDMQGRRAGTPGSAKAAAFIASEFRKAGLQPLKGNSFLQEFSMVRPKLTGLRAEIDDMEVEPDKIIVVTTQPDLKINEKSGYKVQHIESEDNLNNKARAFIRASGNHIVFVDNSFSKNFSRLAALKRQLVKSDNNVVFVLGNRQPKTFSIRAEHQFEETRFTNVVGMLPGKRKKAEQVVFSAHYDHLGIGKPVNGDSIYNGANDDAAGTTAVIMLANYFKKQKKTGRSLVFAAFTAEEIGGYGSQYFSQQLDPAKVVAMFNIEMIGTESKWGAASAYITGFEKSDMGSILQQNLKGSAFTFHADPYPEQQLFYRSDNATLARLGVPAHTISTAKMDSEKYYHSVDDETGTLNMANMTEIIKAIAVSSKTIVEGKDTPSRVKVETLN